jgi:hypothetical protein
MMRRLCLCVWFVLWAGAGSVRAQSVGYIGSDSCIGCHDAEGKSIHQTLHGKAQNPRATRRIRSSARSNVSKAPFRRRDCSFRVRPLRDWNWRRV